MECLTFCDRFGSVSIIVTVQWLKFPNIFSQELSIFIMCFQWYVNWWMIMSLNTHKLVWSLRGGKISVHRFGGGGAKTQYAIIEGGKIWVREIFGIPPLLAVNNDHSLKLHTNKIFQIFFFKFLNSWGPPPPPILWIQIWKYSGVPLPLPLNENLENIWKCVHRVL